MKKLSLVVLFGGFGRFSAFAPSRLNEAMRAGIFSEIVFVINIVSDDELLHINAVARNLEGVFTLVFNRENNIPQGRNLGISLTHEDRIFIWDDDDSLVNPFALQESFQFFMENNLPIMEVPMVFPDGRLFHPGALEIMPQIDSGLQDLVLIGMLHSPFFIKREVWTRIPLPEYVPLRGDWLHYSTMLWEDEIPITCWTKTPVVMEGVRPRDEGATASGNGHEARLQAFTSLIALFAIYDRLTGEDRESSLVKLRYFKKHCSDECEWPALVEAGKNLKVDARACVAQAQQIVRQRLFGVQLGKKSLKPFEALYEPKIAQAIFEKYQK